MRFSGGGDEERMKRDERKEIHMQMG